MSMKNSNDTIGNRSRQQGAGENKIRNKGRKNSDGL
jgi:hypothetical protein